jgi:hypothetical protein
MEGRDPIRQLDWAVARLAAKIGRPDPVIYVQCNIRALAMVSMRDINVLAAIHCSR